MTEQPEHDRPRIVAGDRLTAHDVHEIWKIRDIVFAVEQRCDEPDVDDRDLLPTTTHLWFADDAGPTSYLRVLTDGTTAIGRVCTRREHRGRGLSGRLMRAALDRWGQEPIELHGQAYLEAWYRSFGFVTTGDHFVEAGIDHVPMRREPS